MRFFLVTTLIGFMWAPLSSASAQKPIENAAKPQGPLAVAQLPNVADSCKLGPASSDGLPTWTEVVSNNLGFYRPINAQGNPPITHPTARGVPDLDNPMKNLQGFQSLQSIASLFTNLINTLHNPAQATMLAVVPPTEIGTGICRSTTPDFNGAFKGMVLTEKTYCEYLTECNQEKNNVQYSTFLWVPGKLDFLHKYSIGGNDLLGMANEQVFTFPTDVLTPEDMQKLSAGKDLAARHCWMGPDSPRHRAACAEPHRAHLMEHFQINRSSG